jgi:hypothetical protein
MITSGLGQQERVILNVETAQNMQQWHLHI